MNVDLKNLFTGLTRENNFERNLQAECEIIKYFFAFNQIK